MNEIIKWLESVFNAMPISLLEGWGRFGYVVGLVLLIAAFGGFTFRPGGRWGLGRERQSWDTKALLSILLTFVLIISTGYIGSFIVLVPGAQTFESLKDLSVFLCVVLFGRPALIAVPFAYGISDLAEGVPPDFLWDWIIGYFINPACFWLAFQFIGKNPDFKQARTWSGYGFFVAIFMSIEPQLWGYICSGKFTAEISYRNITPALFFTTAVTWVIAPAAMLVAFPLAKKFGLFWAEIPGHVKERAFGQKDWIWRSGQHKSTEDGSSGQGLPIGMFLATPIIALVLVLVISIAFLTLRSGENGANTLASRLHQEVSLNIDLQVDDYFEKAQTSDDVARVHAINHLLQNSSIAQHGRAFLIDRSGLLMATSSKTPDNSQGLPATGNQDIIVDNATRGLTQAVGDLHKLKAAIQFRFDIVTAKPLARETWLAQATPYQDRSGHIDWIEITATPESAYLAEVRTGNSQSAIVLAVALTLSLLIAVLLAGVMATPLRRMSRSAQSLAEGDLTQRVASSHLEEVDILAKYFNNMAEQLQQTMQNLEAEVTNQTQMKEALSHLSDRLQLATRAAHIGIWDWDIVTNELIWDDAMYRLYGIRKEDFSGAYDAWSASLHPADKTHATEEIQAAIEGKREFHHEFRVVWPIDGSTHIIKAASQTIRDADGKPLRMIGMNIDVTESRHAEEELRRHRDHLEELIAERTSELTIARDQADKANRSKSAFLSNMSHEIRTPLNAIMGMTYLALNNESNPKQRNYLQKVDSAARGLLGIINDILDFSKIEAGKLDFEFAPFLLNDVILHLSDLTLAKAQEKGLKVHFDIDPNTPNALLGDELRLGQILLNLFNNAVKFTEQGQISLSVRCIKYSIKDALLEFEVKDTGIGMTQEQASRLFTPFEQADVSTTRKFGGTGLGLSISKKLVEMMGGSISVETVSGIGSRFTFTVHLALQAEKPQKQLPPLSQPRRYERQDHPSEAAAQIVGAHVLLVEDNDINQELAVYVLTNAGVMVDVANNGAEAVMMVGKKPYDAVLMDCQMPIMDGYAATQEIRKDDRFSTLPILAMSANAMTGDKEKCLAVGMNDHIAKPIDINQLFKMLAHWIKPRELRNTTIEQREQRHSTITQGQELPGVDMAAALKRLNGNTIIYHKLLVMFYERQADVIERIQHAWQKGDREEAQRAAHTLKSIAGNIGADELFSAAEKLELGIKKGDDESYEQHLSQTTIPLETLIKAVAQFLSIPETSNSH